MERLKSWKKWVLLIIDIGLINISYITAFYFRFTSDTAGAELLKYSRHALAITIIYIACFYIFKLYDSLWRHASIDEFMLAVAGCMAANALSILYIRFTGPRLPYSISLMAGLLTIITTVGFRMSFRIYRRGIIMLGRTDKSSFKRVLVIGGGSAGKMIIREMQLHPEMKYNPVGVVDDSREKFGTSILGVKVLGNRHRIDEIARDKNIDLILIAIPSISTNDKTRIINICKKNKLQASNNPWNI